MLERGKVGSSTTEGPHWPEHPQEPGLFCAALFGVKRVLESSQCCAEPGASDHSPGRDAGLRGWEEGGVGSDSAGTLPQLLWPASHSGCHPLRAGGWRHRRFCTAGHCGHRARLGIPAVAVPAVHKGELSSRGNFREQCTAKINSLLNKTTTTCLCTFAVCRGAFF